MSGLLMVYGFPTASAHGTEGFGKNVQQVSLTMTTPNGQSLTPAALQTQIATVLDNGGANSFAIWRPSLNCSPNI